MRNHLIGGALGVALAATVVAGCSTAPAATPTGASSPPTATSASSQATVAGEHNQADITFARQMIPHHTQAVAMTDLAATRATGAEVKDLAGRISRGQGPEIEQMNTMLDTWGAPRPVPSANMSGMSGMQGMMSDQQMGQLATLSGPVFDRTFLAMMTAHHQGAVTMAQTELAAGQNPQAKQLAQAIIGAQQAEIAEMTTLLRPA